jgi:hypothetical protein
MGKIRLNDKEIKLFGGTRSSLGDVEALLTKVSNGQSLTPQQRNDMISTMTMIDQAAKRGGSSANPTQGNSTVAQPETRQYQGHTYVKGADGWVLQQ